MNQPCHYTTIQCLAPGYYVECSCGWRNGSYYARTPAEEAARDHVERAELPELHLKGKDCETLRAHEIEPEETTAADLLGSTMRRLPGLPPTPHFDEVCEIMASTFGQALEKPGRCW